MKNLDVFKKINWKFYINREVNFATEHFMHEGWLKFTQETFGKPVFKRVNIFKSGVADIYVSKDDISLFVDYFQTQFKKGTLKDFYKKSIRLCKDVEIWLPTLSKINYKILSDKELLYEYQEVRLTDQNLALPLILPRLVDMALTSLPEWQTNQEIINTLKDFSNLNEYRRFLTSEKLYKEWIPLFKEIGKRNNLKTQEAFFLLPEEIIQLMTRKITEDIKQKVQKRLSGCFYLIIDGETTVLEEDFFEYELSLKKDVTVDKDQKIIGKCASQGEVTGTIKVIIKEDDYQKIKKGEIVVCAMTQPHISIVTDKISGIITNEGGILCHAAIVARENNIPCLVGTQIATEILKDGDSVYLNATEGYFKITDQSELKPKQISFDSVAWDLPNRVFKRQKLVINFYEAKYTNKLIMWLPGMSDQPFADDENPFLQYFVPTALAQNYSVAVIAFPGTAGNGFIEERTMATLKQNVKDAVKKLEKVIESFNKIEKILVGRSISGTLVGGLLDQDFEKVVIIAGRLRTKELYENVISSSSLYPTLQLNNYQLLGFGSLKPFIKAKNVVKNEDGSNMYCQNVEYLQELLSEEIMIRKVFKIVGQRTKKPQVLAVQSTDDQTVPYQLNDWQELTQKFNIPIYLFSIDYACGHSFTTQPAIAQTSEKILEFITN